MPTQTTKATSSNKSTKTIQETKATQATQESPVLVLRKSDTPPDNFPFSANQVISQHTAWLTKMYKDGYTLSTTLNIAVGSVKEEYYVFYKIV